jgi:hypothetical protein
MISSLDRLAAVIDRHAGRFGMCPGHRDVLLSRIEARHRGAEPRQRLRQHAAAAADIADRKPIKREGRLRIAAVMPAERVADIGEPHRVEPVQDPHRTGLVPPGRREGVEARDLAAIDEAVRGVVRGWPVHA